MAAEPELRPRDDSLVRRPLNYPAAIYVWLAVTLAGWIGTRSTVNEPPLSVLRQLA